MTHDESFLQSIIENPDDDSLRLIYADWLDDHGQPDRAAFVRVQIDLARLPENARQRAELEARERVLLAKHGEEWAGPLSELCEEWKFHRGFIEKVKAAAETVLVRGESLFRLAPVRTLQVSGLNDRLDDLLHFPHLGRLAALDLTLNDVGVAGAEALAAAASLAHLKVLILGGCSIGPDGVQALVSSPILAHMTTLDLAGNSLSEGNVQAMFGHWQLARLTDLSLQGTFIDILELVRWPHLARLTALDLSENDLYFEDEDAQALSSCEYLAGLTSLHLGHDNIGVAGAETLASSPHFGRLTRLNLWGNYIEPVGVQALFSSPSLGNLASLDVSVNHIGDAGAKVIAASPSLANLVRLDLSYNRIGDAGAQSLTESPHTAGLARLDLSHNAISEEVKQRLRERFGDRVHL